MTRLLLATCSARVDAASVKVATTLRRESTCALTSFDSPSPCDFNNQVANFLFRYLAWSSDSKLKVCMSIISSACVLFIIVITRKALTTRNVTERMPPQRTMQSD